MSSDSLAEPFDPRRLIEMALERLPDQRRTKSGGMGVEQVAEAFPEYEIFGIVGRGGSGVVYGGRDSHGRSIALKLLLNETAQDPMFRERFLREARSLSALLHPNLLEVHDFGERDGRCYLVMERVDGEDLRQALSGGRFQPDEAIRIALELCHALRFAHDRGVIHRDVKPANILLDQVGNVRLADFGLAKVLHEASLDALTLTGEALGTLHYMAPEQVTGRGVVDHRADVYALGVVLYEMLTGHLPLGRFTLPSGFIPGAESLDPLIERALAPLPEQRYASVAELELDLEGARLETGAQEPVKTVPQLKLYVGLVVLLVIASAAFPLAYFFGWDEDFERDSGKKPATLVFAALSVPVVLFIMRAGASAARRITEDGERRGLALALTTKWLPLLLAIDGALLAVVLQRVDHINTGAMVGLCFVLIAKDLLFLRWRFRRSLSNQAAP